ncbi:MAG: hypothetical protein K8I03_08425 [Ignavibacteria bacterium]|nr:hypothetical protein [Ignavibacteria bacterium]
MENQNVNQIQRRVWAVSLIVAPLLLTIDQFFWKNGILTITSGWIQVLSFVAWIPAFQGLFDQLKDKFPRYAVYGFLIAIYSCIGGNNFGVEGIYNEVLGLHDVTAANEIRAKFGVGGVFAFYLPGLLFPLSLAVISIQLMRAKKIESWLGIMIVIAAFGFPASRMPRIELIAHIDNFLILITLTLVSVKLYKA